MKILSRGFGILKLEVFLMTKSNNNKLSLRTGRLNDTGLRSLSRWLRCLGYCYLTSLIRHVVLEGVFYYYMPADESVNKFFSYNRIKKQFHT